jgi:hypothetical protein
MIQYTPSRGFVELEIPLLPTTRDPGGVSSLVAAILRDIEDLDGRGQPLDTSDVLQALTIAAAVHETRERSAPGLGGKGMHLEHIELADAAKIRAAA